MRVALSFALVALTAAGACSKGSGSKPTLRIAAASDLEKAFRELGKEFETTTGIAPDFTFGSSGLLAKQIEQQAPFALFAAANASYVDQVIAAGRCDAATAHEYAQGRIVVWTANGIEPPAQLADLANPRFKKIAIANPEHAPYGKAAKEALDKAGLWPQIQDRIVLAENIQQTMLYARNGNADAAVVAQSLAVVTDGGHALSIAPSLYTPLHQRLVVCGTGPEADAARKFAAFLASREGTEVMTRYGFEIPAAAPAP